MENNPDKVRSSAGTLVKHKKAYTEGQKFTCEVCKKSFRYKGDLTAHKRIHLGIDKFKCSICEKIFNHSGNLKGHIRSHTGEKPFECASFEKTLCFEKRFEQAYKNTHRSKAVSV